MKLNIIIPFRPITNIWKYAGNTVYQGEDYKWYLRDDHISRHPCDGYTTPLENCVKAIRKNSVYYHRIIVVHEPDCVFNQKYLDMLKEKYDVNFHIFNVNKDSMYRNVLICAAMRDVIMSLSNDDIVCYAYNADCICGKYWDKYVKEATDSYGSNCVYTPLWVEPRSRHGGHASSCGPSHIGYQLENLSGHSIWNEWRKLCCHSPSMQCPTDRTYMIEKDIDEWSAACNSYGKDNIVEKCGSRSYGYWCAMIAKNKIFKDAAHYLLIPGSPDLSFESGLNTNKVVVTKSHVFHLHFACRLDNIEVEHIKE